MKKHEKKLLSLLLAACLLLGLTACGSKNGGDSRQLSGTVYVADFLDVDLPGIEYINQSCADNEYIYFTADIRGEEKEETWTHPETGETETSTYYETRPGLFRVPVTGGAAAEMENYAMSEIPEGSEGRAYLNSIQTGADGTLWVTESMTVYHYDLPDDFNEETDEKWEYQTDYEDTTIRRQLDSTGAEIDRIDLTDLAEKAGVEYVNEITFDKAGNVYLIVEDKVAVLDKDLEKLFELALEDHWGDLVPLGDGSMGVLSSYSDEENDRYGYHMRQIDQQAQDWGTQVYELSQNAYSAIPGGGDYLFYYQNGDSVYGWKAGAAEGEKIFSWLSSGVNRSDIDFFSFLPDGRVAAVGQDWNDDGTAKLRLAVLTPTDARNLPEKTTLTMATMWLSYETRNKIMEFNQNSDTCRIEVVDYSEYNTGEDSSAGLTRLNAEIVARHAPDLIYNSNLPLSRYAAKGILEDLWPYIERDEEIGGRSALMEHVLDVASVDGKLYQAFSSFSIQSVVGSAALVGDRMSWTLADLQEALGKMPEGCTIFGEEDTKSGMLSQVLSMNLDQFVDWEKGTCSFDSDAFKALLSFCDSFPEEFDWESIDWDLYWASYKSDYERAMSGNQMLLTAYLYDFIRPQFYDKLFNGGASFIGYPMEDGSVGSCFSPSSSYAMSSTCKDKEAAWSFIRQMFLPQAEENEEESTGRLYFGGFPVNRSDFEKYKESAMTESFETDENGEKILDENGEPIRILQDSWYLTDDQRIEIYAATQEDVDKVMALYESIDSVYGYDESIFNIINDVVGAYFSGDQNLDTTASGIQNRVQLYIGENT